MSSDIDYVPDDCIFEIISRTSPRDAYNFALTSTSFKWVVDSDFVWQSFLPSGYASILSRAVEPVKYTSKKDLFFKLSERHVLIEDGTMSFGLNKSSGAKCFMISASLLKIAFADEPHFYWRLLSFPGTRFSQVAEPVAQCKLSITAKVKINAFSEKTRYGAYLVYQLIEIPGDDFSNIGRSRHQASISVDGNRTEKVLYLEPLFDMHVKELYSGWGIPTETIGESAKKRSDGWTEVEIGEFCTGSGGDRDVDLMLKGIDSHHCQGIIIEGIEIRPKH